MNRRRASAFVVALSAVVGLSWGPAGGDVASAIKGSGSTTQQPPSPSNQGGTNATNKTVASGQCHYYVVKSGRFGHSCNGTITGQTVRQILDPHAEDNLPTCWDVPMDAQDIDDYGLEPLTPDAQYKYFIHECANPGGWSLDLPPSYQPNLHVDEHVVEIDDPQRPCPKPFDLHVLPRACVMWLTEEQKKVVDPGNRSAAQVPGILLIQHPTTQVRTNEPVSYSDEIANGTGQNPRRTDTQVLNGSAMWAELSGYRIYPYGLDHGAEGGTCTIPTHQYAPAGPADMRPGVCKECDGVDAVSQTDTPASKPDACWWSYTRSSADQPGQRYPFRAEATWTIKYNNGRPGSGDQTLSTVVEYDDVQLPVFDVQSIVVGTG